MNSMSSSLSVCCPYSLHHCLLCCLGMLQSLNGFNSFSLLQGEWPDEVAAQLLEWTVAPGHHLQTGPVWQRGQPAPGHRAGGNSSPKICNNKQSTHFIASQPPKNIYIYILERRYDTWIWKLCSTEGHPWLFLMSVRVLFASDGAVRHSLSCWSLLGQPGPERTGAGWEAPHPQGGSPRVCLHQVPHPL